MALRFISALCLLHERGMIFIHVLLLLGIPCLRGKAAPDDTYMILRFAQEPADTQFAHTRYAVLNCIVDGSPKPTVTWKLARTNVEVTNVTGLRYVMANGSLVFPPFPENQFDSTLHQAEYQCLAVNELGKIISRAAKLRAVVVKPFNVYAVDHRVMEGNPAVLRAIIPKSVRDYVTVKAWHKHRDVINVGGRYSVMPSGDLVIGNVRRDDAMFDMYHFTIINKLTGEIQASNPAKLFILDQQSLKSHMTSGVHNLTIIAGETAELQCSADGYPIPHYAWRKNGVSLNIMDRYSLFAGGSLRIERTEEQDEAVYTCDAINKGGSDSITVYLKVHVPVSFTHRPKPKESLIGHARMEMGCEVKGKPKPAVTWYHNAKPVDISKERISIKYNNLVFATVYGSDIGVYQCVADNGKELEQSSAEFYVGFVPPKFTATSSELVLNPGSRLEISCEVKSTPTAYHVFWYHDDEPILEDMRQGYSINTKPGGKKYTMVSKLTKSAVTLGDSGEYKCRSNNAAGSAEQIIKVYVTGSPNITYYLNEVTGIQGQVIALPCRVKGYPLPKITWTKAGFVIPYDQRHLVADNGTLFIRNVQKRADQGKYICTAANHNGIKVSVTVNVNIMVAPVITRWNPWPPVDKGHFLHQICVVASGDQPKITWLKNGHPITSDPKVLNITGKGSVSAIETAKVHERNAGTYTCIASNKAGTTRQSARLVVFLAADFIEEPKDQQVLKERTAHMTCKTFGYPPARVEWNKATGDSLVPLNNDPRVSQLLNGTLVIRNVSKSDEGRYTCTAYNGVVGTPVRRQVNLVVHVPAAIVSPPVDRSQVVDGDVSFTCVSVGNLPIVMTWYNGTKLLSDNRRVHIWSHTVDNEHVVNGTLRVTGLRLRDTTEYSCKVINKFGEDQKYFRITAQERPSPPSKPTIGRVGATYIELLWTPEFNGNSPITKYFIDYRWSDTDWNSQKPETIKKTTGGSARTYLLDQLKPATNYHVRLYAVNAIGTSNPGLEAVTTTKEDAPSSPPVIDNCTAISSTAVYIEWQPPSKKDCNGVIIGYYISYRQSNRFKSHHNITISGGAIRSHVITGLAKYKPYSIEMQAFTRAGPSPRSETKEVMTQEDVPSKPPQFVEVKVISSTTISVSWKAPHQDSIHGRLQGYKIRYHRVDQPDNVHVKKVGSNILNVTIRKLGKFTTYKIIVLAFTSKGDGAKSTETKVTTAEDIPGPPADVQAIPVYRKQIRVRWKEPKEPNGIIREYKLFFSTNIEKPPMNDSTKKVYMSTTNGNVTSYNVKHLESDTVYYFWVVARTSVGTGNASKTVKQRTEEKIPANVFDPYLPDTMEQRMKTAILNCEAYGDPKPTIFWYSGGKDLSDEDKYVQFTNGSLKIKSLDKSDTGDYVCTASNRLGKKTVTRTLKVQIPPYPPKGITIKVVPGIPSAINISWTPGFDGYSNITVFLLEIKVQRAEWRDVYIFKATYYVMYKVDHTKPYFFKLSALNGVGRGKPSKIIKVTFAAKGTIATVRQVDSVDEAAEDDSNNKRFYNDPAVLGTLITISVLIIIVLLLLVACRFKRVSWKLPTDWKDVWDKAILGHPAQRSEETSSGPPDNGHGDDMNGDNTESRSPSSDGHLADSSSSVEQMASTRGSLLSLPRSSGFLHHNLAHEPIMEEPFPPPPPPYQGTSPMRSLLIPPLHHDDNVSDTSSEISFGGPVYHRPMLHDNDFMSRSRRTPITADPLLIQHPLVRSLNDTPRVSLGMRGPADGGSELDNTSLAMRGHESNADLRKTFGSRLGRNSKQREMSEETVRSIYARTPASGISRMPDFGSRHEIGRKSVGSRRGSSASQKVAPLNKPLVENLIDTTPVIYRRDSVSSKESNSYPPELEKAIAAARDARAYDSTSSEYSSSRDELYAALEFGKRNNFEKFYGIPTLETTSMSSEATNSSEQDGICKFSGSPRTVGDGFYAPVPLRQPYYMPRSRSRNNEAYLYVLDPRRRVMDGGPVRVRSQLDHKGSLV